MNIPTNGTKPQLCYEDFEQHRSRLMRLALKLVRISGTAEDLVQDCLIKAWLHREGFHGNCRVYTWLHRILLNTAFDHLQRHRHEVLASSLTRESEADGALEIPDIATPEEHLIARQRAQALLNKLEALPPSLTDTLQLRYWDDLSYAEIAQSLQVPINTVRTRLHRAHQALGIK